MKVWCIPFALVLAANLGCGTTVTPQSEDTLVDGTGHDASSHDAGKKDATDGSHETDTTPQDAGTSADTTKADSGPLGDTRTVENGMREAK